MLGGFFWATDPTLWMPRRSRPQQQVAGKLPGICFCHASPALLDLRPLESGHASLRCC